jgi:hypothetical protein
MYICKIIRRDLMDWLTQCRLGSPTVTICILVVTQSKELEASEEQYQWHSPPLRLKAWKLSGESLV